MQTELDIARSGSSERAALYFHFLKCPYDILKTVISSLNDSSPALIIVYAPLFIQQDRFFFLCYQKWHFGNVSSPQKEKWGLAGD